MKKFLLLLILALSCTSCAKDPKPGEVYQYGFHNPWKPIRYQYSLVLDTQVCDGTSWIRYKYFWSHDSTVVEDTRTTHWFMIDSKYLRQATHQDSIDFGIIIDDSPAIASVDTSTTLSLYVPKTSDTTWWRHLNIQGLYFENSEGQRGAANYNNNTGVLTIYLEDNRWEKFKVTKNGFKWVGYKLANGDSIMVVD